MDNTRVMVIIMGFILTGVLPTLSAESYQEPYTDNERTVALWHFDDIRGGKYVMDDDSASPFRDADLVLIPNRVYAKNGPTLADPAKTSDLSYPANNPAFNTCLSLNGTTQEGPLSCDLLTFNPANIRIEGWFKGTSTNAAVLFDRWNQIVVYAEPFGLSVATWDTNEKYTRNEVLVPSWNSKAWNHFAIEVINENLTVYLNGALAGGFTVNGGVGKTPSKTSTFIGNRYRVSDLFNGFIDEFRISTAVPSVTADTDGKKWRK